ncbi:helix-turn-helix domain-containing protein [Rhodoplanes sp. TEM]|uniref:Helix-turn-helix domain-containing protein n=1 Tax=Rhodoplanes tepidamans TaxID=200616 RepID=A0ABT5JDC3_RHOTP|nr:MULTISPECIES: helix-turn-helix domain-containing protein [Rhodoplanes]MDC7787637.1 helix-turn-helix domain-containing protein [Rhodoplanes tepidamans]MDC7984547.1 helix-turn-helix domain-containing protein [Rhodoplanes sp. TEM]MDQ0355206.1 AraC-like DNA-binding protein [Rhodoplanes tepidamans]
MLKAKGVEQDLSGVLGTSLLAGSLAGQKVQLQAIRPALTGREWTLGRGEAGRLNHAVLVAAGQGHLVGPEPRLDFSGPALVWVPPRSAARLHLEAGAGGWLLAIADDLIASTISGNSESIVLAAIAARLLAVPVGSPAALDDLAHSFAAIERELAAAARGSWTAVTAHVALVMVGLWRASGIEAVAGRSGGPASSILQRFRHLVELHFREHWRIPRYAAALAVSPDRLHAICLRELARSPLTLVHERLVREAMLLLERSMLTVEQISAHLGFKDPAHFNRFFKANAGLPPGAFRHEAARSAAHRSLARTHHSYADWP